MRTSQVLNIIRSVNDAFTNSAIPVTINLVGVHVESYVSMGDYSQDLGYLEVPDDGVMDDVAVLRRQFGADMVTLLVNDYGMPRPEDPRDVQVLGIGNELLSKQGNPNAAFSSRSCRQRRRFGLCPGA